MADLNPYNQSTYSTLAGWDLCPSLNQPEYTGFISPKILFSGGTMASEAFTTIYAPGGVPLDHSEHELSEPLPDTFCENMISSTKPNPGPVRTWQASTRRFEPYGRPDVGIPTPQPTMRLIPETAADAEMYPSETEGDKGTGPERTRKPYGSAKPRRSRKQEERDFKELCGLVREWKGLSKAPTKNEALTDALEYIETVRVAVYERPRLGSRDRKPFIEGSAHAKWEWEYRNAERTLFEELSRYYRLESDGGEDGNAGGGEGGERGTLWRRPSLLKEVLEDLKVRYPPTELSTNEQAGPAT